MKVRVVIGPGHRWTFQAEPEGEAEARREFSFGSSGLLAQLWQRLLIKYHRARRAIETREHMRWVRELLRRLEARADPGESLLRRVRAETEIVLLVPASLSAGLVRRRFLRFLRRRARAHARGIVFNVLLLPVTAAMALLPGPNVFFAWNAYRLIAHALAWQGARRVLRGECALHVRAAREDEPVANANPSAPCIARDGG
jgi:hypothetical protein